MCMTGLVGNKWSFDNFEPMEVIPDGRLPHDLRRRRRRISCGCRFRNCLTRSAPASCASRSAKYSISTKSWRRTALMEENKAGGKIVVLT